MTPYTQTHPLTQIVFVLILLLTSKNLHKSIDRGFSILFIHGREHLFKQHVPFTEVTSLLSLSHTFGIDDEQTDEFVFSDVFLKPFRLRNSVSCSLLNECIFDVEFLDE